MDRDELLKLLRAFETEALEYVLIGATAMGFHGIVRAAEIKQFSGVSVRVATPRALYRLKKDTMRPLDHQDAAVIAERFNLKETDWDAGRALPLG